MSTEKAEKVKQTHLTLNSNVNLKTMKRSNTTDTGENPLKKIRIDPSSINTANIKSKMKNLSEASCSQYPLRIDVNTGTSLAVTSLDCDISNETTEDASKELILHGFESEDSCTSRAADVPGEYVILNSKAMDYVDKNERIISSAKQLADVATTQTDPNVATLDSIVNTSSINVLPAKDITLKDDTAISINPHILKQSEARTDEIELVLLPTSQEPKLAALQAPTIDANATKPAKSTIINPVTSCANIRNSTITCNRISSLVTAGNSGSANILSRVSIQPAIKNQPLMVTAKKLMSEVTQTTAKVSIGNTTISVPLLKPLNSKHILQQSSLASDLQKQALAGTMQPSQLNISKILNVKRGQKINQPTFLSLSQLQIKPVSNAKIVQAKVISKKFSQVTTTVQSNTSTNTVVNVSGASTKQVLQNFKPKISPPALQEFPATKIRLDEEKTFNCIASAVPFKSVSVETSDNIQKQMQNRNMLSENKNSNTDELSALTLTSTKLLNTETDDIGSNKNSIKILSTPNAGNVPPLLTPLSKSISIDQQGNITQQLTSSTCPTVSIIKQNATFSNNPINSSISMSVADTELKKQTDATVQSTKSGSSTIATATKRNVTSLITVNRNISLMVTKSSNITQNKTNLLTVNNSSLNVENAPSSSLEHSLKKINLSNTFNITPMKIEPSQTKSLVQSLETQTTNKQTILTAQKQPSFNQEIMGPAKKMVKIASCSLNVLNHPPVKRSKSTDESERHYHNVAKQSTLSKPQSLELLPENNNSNISTEAPKDALKKQQTNAEFNAFSSSSASATQPSQGSIVTTTALMKSEETHNVLLKQLLQNSSISQNIGQIGSSTATSSTTSPICTQVISSRKVINVRAPSLGLVSSLQAQLARPVIPPAPVSASTATVQQLGAPQAPTSKLQKNVNSENAQMQCATDIEHNDAKLKPSIQIISKETSFVSNPNLNTFSMEHAVEDALEQIEPSDFNEITSAVGTEEKSNKMSVLEQMDNVAIPIKKEEERNINSNIKAEVNFNQILASSQQPSLANISSSSNLPLDKKSNNNVKSSLSSLLTSNESSTIKSEENNQQHILNYNNKFTSSTDTQYFYNRESLVANNHSAPTTPVAAATATAAASSIGLNKSQVNMKNSSSTSSKEIELRKRRKREYQKHRRQLLSNSKDATLSAIQPAAGVPGLKKRPRKFPKIEEDYDNFTDNLMTYLRQMHPLQVLEPLLNRNFGFSNMYGKSYPTFAVGSKDNGVISQHLLGDYGSAQSPNKKTLYDNLSLSQKEVGEAKSLSIIQNDFYDQEFLPIKYKNEDNKLARCLSVIRERNIEAVETIKCEYPTKRLSSVSLCNSGSNSFPGLVLMNTVTHKIYGRMSPIAPIVNSASMKVDHLITSFKTVIDEDIKPNIESLNKKGYERFDSKIGCKTETNLNNHTIILSLQPSIADDILGVLKDLANLLRIPPPTTYKIFDTNTHTFGKPFEQQDAEGSNVKKKINYKRLQQILNGRRKMCRNCGQFIPSKGIVASKSAFPVENTVGFDVKTTNTQVHFCTKNCFAEYNIRTNTSNAKLKINRKLNSVQERKKCNQIKSVNCNNNNKFFGMDAEVKQELIEERPHVKHFKENCFQTVQPLKRISEKEVMDLLFKMNITMTANKPVKTLDVIDDDYTQNSVDIRQCALCNQYGDGISIGPSRLLNFEVDKWVHLNCALWSNGVYETISGGLMNFQSALQAGLNQQCSICQQFGATVKCFKSRCGVVFHLPCAYKEHCVFYKNKTIHCQQHASRMEKENELPSLSVYRRVFVERDENRQVATVMHHSELSNLLRVGSLTLLNVGQLLPHQLEAFHTVNYIYPIGYKIIRFYWSMKRPNKRCRYICTIAEVAGCPEFRIQVQEPMENDIELRDNSPKAVWLKVLQPIAQMRREHNLVQHFPQFIAGEDLFGLTEPSIVRIIESLPGVETLTDYRFKYGRNPLLELPLAINPSGTARTEPKQRQLMIWRKPHTQRTSTTYNQRNANVTSSVIAGEVTCPYSKQFVHSKSSQYKKMKQEWRNNVYLARSKIQGLGLYAARDMEKHTMIIEYIGEVIRTEVSEIREKQYEAKNRGIYMFRLDEDRVVDATLSGGLARYINHSCNPNCVTEIVEVDRELRIIIFAKRKINRSEELSYDYKFDIEDDGNKIPCMCGAPNCRKWMN